MEYNIPSKKTIYNGRVYRSRLEAKWACMFDKFGWRYEYEPAEINGYNPDFIISSKHHMVNSIIVEIKPKVMVTESLIQATLKKYDKVPAHILILTDFPFENSTSGCDYNGVQFGIGSEYFGHHEREDSYDEEMFGPWVQPPHRSEMCSIDVKCFNDIASPMYIWDGWVNSEIERKHFIEVADETHFELLKEWTNAGNEVMFQVEKKQPSKQEILDTINELRSKLNDFNTKPSNKAAYKLAISVCQGELERLYPNKGDC